MEVTKQACVIANVRFHVYQLSAIPASSSSCCMVYVMHGRLGACSDLHELCVEMCLRFNAVTNASKEGSVVVVTFDNPNHGELTLDAKRNFAFADGNPTHGVDMYAQMTAAVDAVKLGLDFLPLVLNMRVSRKPIVTGISQGGHAALLAMTHEARLGACVAWIGTGNFGELMRARVMQQQQQQQAVVFPLELARLIAERDPVNNLGKLVGRWVCVINGLKDALVPAALNQGLMDRLASANGGSTAKQVTGMHAGVAHTVTRAMYEQGFEFIEAYLRGAEMLGML
jgi:dienelactone hydrolase